MQINQHESSISFSLNPFTRRKNNYKIKDFKTERKIKESLLLGKKVNINFFKEIKISEFEYIESKKESDILIETFTLELFINFISNDQLINIQKHTFELFSYLINVNMDWSLFKKKMSYQALIEKMKDIKYENFSHKQFNYYLNRLSTGKEFPRFIPLSKGMNHIYKWVRTQIYIYIYLINSKLIENNKLPKINLKINEKDKDKKTNKNQSITSSVALEKTIDISLPTFSRNLSTNFIDKTPSKINSSGRRFPINIKIKKKKNLNFIDEEKRYNLKTNILSLDGYNAYAEKIKREKKNLGTLPFAFTKDYNEIRLLYQSKKNVRYRNNNIKELKNYSLNYNEKSKILSMLSNNKISILGNLNEKKIKELL